MEAGQLEAHLGAQLRVQIGKRLVEEEESRLNDEGARQRDALLLAPRELGRPPTLETLEPDLGEGGFDLAPELGARDAPLAQSEGDVLEDGHVRPERVLLEDHAEIALPRRHRVDGLVVHEHAPFVRRGEAREHSEERGLAAAGGAEQRIELSGTYGQGHVLHRPRRPVALADVLHSHFGQADHRLVLLHALTSFEPRPGPESPARSGTTVSPRPASTR